MKSKNLFILFTTFFKIGLFTFGGGYAMIPLIESEISKKHKFITEEEILDIISISELTPGPISINCATFIGYKVNGFMGALLSTIGVVLPSFVVILLISLFYDLVKNLPVISGFLHGIKVGVVLILISSVLKLNSKRKKVRIHSYLILLVLFILIFTNITSIEILFSSIILFFIIFSLTKNRRGL